jgi:hypothetical protein
VNDFAGYFKGMSMDELHELAKSFSFGTHVSQSIRPRG